MKWMEKYEIEKNYMKKHAGNKYITHRQPQAYDKINTNQKR